MRLFSFRDPLKMTIFDPGGVIFATSVFDVNTSEKYSAKLEKTEYYWLVEVN